MRDDSTRVVQELVEYVASNARSEAESVARVERLMGRLRLSSL
ncbi:MAG: hypothetical protein WDM87_15240 [Terracidiphilus sp.]